MGQTCTEQRPSASVAHTGGDGKQPPSSTAVSRQGVQRVLAVVAARRNKESSVRTGNAKSRRSLIWLFLFLHICILVGDKE